MHGYGCYLEANGLYIEGEWEEDLPSGYVGVLLPDGE